MTAPRPPAPRRPPTVNANAVIFASVALVIGLLGAAVALSYNNRPPEFIIGILGAVGTTGALLIPVIGKLFALGDLNQHQTDQLDTIEHQTNGELDRKINAAVNAAAQRAAAAAQRARE